MSTNTVYIFRYMYIYSIYICFKFALFGVENLQVNSSLAMSYQCALQWWFIFLILPQMSKSIHVNFPKQFHIHNLQSILRLFSAADSFVFVTSRRSPNLFITWKRTILGCPRKLVNGSYMAYNLLINGVYWG